MTKCKNGAAVVVVKFVVSAYVSVFVSMVGLSGLTPEHKGVQQVISLSAEKVVARSEGREVSSVLLEHKRV